MGGKTRKLTCLAVLAVLLAAASPARAADYVQPTLENMLAVMLRFGALDVNNDLVMDDYAKIRECDLYKAFSGNDFKWRGIRTGLRGRARAEVVTAPINFYAKGLVSLDRYDFENKIFRLNLGEGGIRGVNSFLLVEAKRNPCGTMLKIMPQSYSAVLDAQISIPGFIMDESDANALLERMLASGNTARQVVAKFNLRIVYIEKVTADLALADKWYDQRTIVGTTKILRMDAKLDTVEFFEDKDMTKRIYVYKP